MDNDYRAKREAIRKAIYESLSEEDKKAYDATAARREVYDALPNAEKKRLQEMRVFDAFVFAAQLTLEPESATNEEPPHPDIRCLIAGSPYRFELGEITDEGLATAFNEALRTMEITGGAFSQENPFIGMFRKKATRSYETQGDPVDLVLYYDKQYPHDEALEEYLVKYANEIDALMAASPFSRMWVFDSWRKIILWKMIR